MYVLFSKELDGHESEHGHTAHEENEDIKDVWDGTTNVPERTTHLQTRTEHHQRETDRQTDRQTEREKERGRERE